MLSMQTMSLTELRSHNLHAISHQLIVLYLSMLSLLENRSRQNRSSKIHFVLLLILILQPPDDSKNIRTRFNGRQLYSLLQDVDMKYERIKVSNVTHRY